ncbi:hypothetical protein [Micromonospora sp. URMC 103]|uniref:hypothetical protein n=1 Tax=Micromonospora sp. URMC 103 TaxID=3423406 RepID=UPI003F1C608E
MDDITPNAALAAGFTFADVRAQFVGHQLCGYGEVAARAEHHQPRRLLPPDGGRPVGRLLPRNAAG